MKAILGAVLGGILLVPVPAVAAAQPAVQAPTDQSARITEARAIIAVMFPPDQREKMFAKLQSDLMSQLSVIMPAEFMADPGLKAIFEQFKDDAMERQRPVMMKHLPLQMEAMADAYCREFSLAELKEIHAFALTPSGGHYLSKSMSLVGDPAVAKANTDAIAEIQATTQELLPGFKEKAIAYLKAHPDVAARIEKNGK